MSLPCSSITSSAGRFSLAAVVFFGTLLAAAPSRGDVCVWRDPERTMQKIFPEARDYKTVTVRMTPERVAAVEKALGGKLEESEKEEFNFYEIFGGKGKGHRIGTIVALAGAGEYGTIEVVTGLDGKGRIVGAYIQRTRERASKAIQSSKFLGQFAGKSRGDGFDVGKEIRAESPESEAASRTVAFLVRKMLCFHDVLNKGGMNP